MDNKKIGCFIAQQRKQMNMTQQQLADILSISNKTVSKWETGEGYPDISIVFSLCKTLNISTEEFFVGERMEKYSNTNIQVAVNLNTTSESNLLDSHSDHSELVVINKGRLKKYKILFFVILFIVIVIFIYVGFIDSPSLRSEAFNIWLDGN